MKQHPQAAIRFSIIVGSREEFQMCRMVRIVKTKVGRFPERYEGVVLGRRDTHAFAKHATTGEQHDDLEFLLLPQLNFFRAW